MDDLAQSAREGHEADGTVPFAGGELARAAVPLRDAKGVVQGAVVVSTFMPVAVAAERREVQERYTKYRKAESFKEPIKAVYLSLYLFPALLILFGAVWLSLYLARRITTPLRLVAEGAERIASGERGVRVDFPSGDDEFAALIASFNRMSERLARSEEEVEHTRAGLTRKNEELEERRRLMETVLETVGTGVVVVDAEGTITALNAAACRLLDVSADRVGRSLADALPGPGRDEVVGLVQRLLSGRGTRQEREVVVPGRGRDRHLAVTVVPLPGRARLAAGSGARPRRPHAADARAEGGGLGRGGAQARPRDQEPAHPHPALRAARAQGLPEGRARFREGPRRVHGARSCTRWTRSRTWWTSSRSSRGCPPPTSCRARCTTSSSRPSPSTTGCSPASPWSGGWGPTCPRCASTRTR